MKVSYTCPLGHTCEKAVEGEIQRCAWYVKVEGNDQKGMPVSERRCAMAWQPILMVEQTGHTIGVAHSVQSMRNETIKRQDAALGLVKNAKAITNK